MTAIPFDNTYARLPEQFYERIDPVPVLAPRLIRLNLALADRLGLRFPEDEAVLADMFSGNKPIEGAEPLAQAYAGHQFGHFVPQLGDGRAVLLGEVGAPDGQRFDIQLKGSGRTRFSRGGDGRSPLGPVIREYVVSEAMHALGIPSSRALAMVATGETVHRENELPGGVLTRVAASHIRVGTFEYFAARGDTASLRLLADYVIDRHYPVCRDAADPYAELFRQIADRVAGLVAQWMGVGFIHGVMNTDNTSVAGETIDFGPCAFMDVYSPSTVFSSIDGQGRYAYENQSAIAQWNLSSLGGCLAPLMANGAEGEAGRETAEAVLAEFPAIFARHLHKTMSRKIGIENGNAADYAVVRDLLRRLHEQEVDFTVAFRELARWRQDGASFLALFTEAAEMPDWVGFWRAHLGGLGIDFEDALIAMRAANPARIPRNHRLEQAIRAAEDHGDFAPAHQLIKALSAPYEDLPEFTEYEIPPEPSEVVHRTFCGT
ncbi:protein adenylyltransferase SelO [Pseudodesulfovibrio sp.]|uniref:protein adenylyltransferase SelO n=1 Tax=unclassified Pseudodesulfovibrio TaxID=2661612 RepID=UPI003B009D48